MSGLATLLRKIGGEHGIEVDDAELEAMGLSLEEDGVVDDMLLDEVQQATDETLSGEAAGAVEIFLSDPRSWLAGDVQETAEGFWEPIIREGQWAVRPGPGGQKVKRPLKVVAGRSKNQRKEIGLQDIVEAFDDGAIEHVTVPTSHQNDVTQNTGFIRALKLVDGEYTPKGSKTKAKKKVKVLMGLYDIKLPEVKRRIKLGAIANRSAGLLYDYVNTETGKSYGVALEHVALTNKPWITGMRAFGRKLVKKVGSTVGLSLSDEEPTEDELLAQEDALESIELAMAEVTWSHEESPTWLQQQVTDILTEARSKKIAKRREASKSQPQASIDYDWPPQYRCCEARPGSALIADGWGDGANYWIATIKVEDGKVDLASFDEWTAVKKAYVVDEREKPSKEDEPLKQEPIEDVVTIALTPLQLAQHARRRRASGGDTTDDNNDHPRGGEHMAGENGGTATLQLSDEARDYIQRLEKKLEASDARIEELTGTVGELRGRDQTSEADKFVGELKAMGFSEDRGFTGFLSVVHDLLSNDDGGPAVQATCFADDGNQEGTLSLSDAFRRAFKAIELAEDGRLKLGAQLSQPSEEAKPGEPGGKPAAEDPTDKVVAFHQLSEARQDAELFADSPEVFGGKEDNLSEAAREELKKLLEERSKNNGSGGEG